MHCSYFILLGLFETYVKERKGKERKVQFLFLIIFEDLSVVDK